MTAAKIAITIDPAQLARARAAVRSGRAESVSSYIGRALERHAQEEALDGVVRDLIAEYGEPNAKDIAWARRVLGLKRRRNPA